MHAGVLDDVVSKTISIHKSNLLSDATLALAPRHMVASGPCYCDSMAQHALSYTQRECPWPWSSSQPAFTPHVQHTSIDSALPSTNICLCIQVFKYFDVGLNGRLDYNQFFAAMTRLNFVGVQVRHGSRFLSVTGPGGVVFVPKYSCSSCTGCYPWRYEAYTVKVGTSSNTTAVSTIYTADPHANY